MFCMTAASQCRTIVVYPNGEFVGMQTGSVDAVDQALPAPLRGLPEGLCSLLPLVPLPACLLCCLAMRQPLAAVGCVAPQAPTARQTWLPSSRQ